MLLLSSATRIFGTKTPSGDTSTSQATPAAPRPCRVPCLHFIGAFAGVLVNLRGVGVCRKSILTHSTHVSLALMGQNNKGRSLFAAPLISLLNCLNPRPREELPWDNLF